MGLPDFRDRRLRPAPLAARRPCACTSLGSLLSRGRSFVGMSCVRVREMGGPFLQTSGCKRLRWAEMEQERCGCERLRVLGRRREGQSCIRESRVESGWATESSWTCLQKLLLDRLLRILTLVTIAPWSIPARAQARHLSYKTANPLPGDDLKLLPSEAEAGGLPRSQETKLGGVRGGDGEWGMVVVVRLD